jgi:hypothetical protein
MQILRKVCSTPDSAWDTVAERASVPCFNRAGAATSRAPWRLAAVMIQRASDNPGLYPEKGGINDEPK